MSYLNKCAFFVMSGIRPLLGPSECRYSVTCTKFAQDQLEKKRFFVAVWAIIKRVLSCNPLW